MSQADEDAWELPLPLSSCAGASCSAEAMQPYEVEGNASLPSTPSGAVGLHCLQVRKANRLERRVLLASASDVGDMDVRALEGRPLPGSRCARASRCEPNGVELDGMPTPAIGGGLHRHKAVRKVSSSANRIERRVLLASDAGEMEERPLDGRPNGNASDWKCNTMRIKVALACVFLFVAPLVCVGLVRLFTQSYAGAEAPLMLSAKTVQPAPPLPAGPPPQHAALRTASPLPGTALPTVWRPGTPPSSVLPRHSPPTVVRSPRAPPPRVPLPSPPSPGWNLLQRLNCYSGFGGVDMDGGQPWRAAIDVASCKAGCAADTACVGITYTNLAVGPCYRRSAIMPCLCLKDNNYNSATIVRAVQPLLSPPVPPPFSTPPADPSPPRSPGPPASPPGTAGAYRAQLARTSLDLVLAPAPDSCTASVRDRALADISPLCTIFQAALDTLGVHGVLVDVMATAPFEQDLQAAAAARGLDLVTRYSTDHMTLSYFSEIDAIRDSDPVHLFGGLWWLRHWLGAYIAECVLDRGGVRLDEHSTRRITTSAELIEVVQALQMAPASDFVTIAVEHAAVWHFVGARGPKMTRFPRELATAWCRKGNLVNGLDRECRYAFGHAVFYNVRKPSQYPAAKMPSTSRVLVR